MSLPRPFRLVYRSFDRIDFDPRKSDEIFAHRGFDLAYVARIFPGTVLEREDTRSYAEKRYQALGELLGNVFLLVYTRSGRHCRLITASVAEPYDRIRWYELTH